MQTNAPPFRMWHLGDTAEHRYNCIVRVHPFDHLDGQAMLVERCVIIELNLALAPGAYHAMRKVFTECASENYERRAKYRARINNQAYSVVSESGIAELDRLTLFVRRLIDLHRESLGSS